MFIQCQHCHTTYKIDENRLPQKESVVRCTKCAEPISLNRDKQVELLKNAPKKLVKCGECGTQYSVPLKSIGKESTRARCGKCGNLFQITLDSDVATISDDALSHDHSKEYEETDIDLDNIDIPQESEIEVDELFDNIGDQDDSTDGELDNEDSLTSKNADDEYLESVSLGSDDDSLEDDLEIDGIANDQKYKIFLKPESLENSDGRQTNGERDSWPEIEDESPDEDDLELDEFTDLDDIDDVPGEAKQKPAKKEPSKKPAKKNRLLWLLWIVILVVLAAVGWRFFYFNADQDYPPPQIELHDTEVKDLGIIEPLKGKLIKNKHFNRKLFVLSGDLLNVYGSETAVSRIEIEGFLYSKDRDQPYVSTSYAGVTISEDGLKNWTKEKIESKLMSQAQDTENILEFGENDLINFQIVFFDAPGQKSINKMGAKIKQFYKKSLGENKE